MKKKRIPKPVRIPIMKSTVDVFAQELRFGLMTAQLNQFSSKNFDRIAGIINLLMFALEGKIVDKSVEAAIDGAARVMNEVDARYEKFGTRRMSEYDILAVSAGIEKIEEQLPKLTITELRAAQIKLEMLKNVP